MSGPHPSHQKVAQSFRVGRTGANLVQVSQKGAVGSEASLDGAKHLVEGFGWKVGTGPGAGHATDDGGELLDIEMFCGYQVCEWVEAFGRRWVGRG